MLSATALLMIAPLMSQSQVANAREKSRGYNKSEPGMVNTYGIAPNVDPSQIKSKGKGGSGKKLGVDLRSNHSHVNGTKNAKYIHDHSIDGFLVLNVNKKGKLNKPGRVFGPNPKKFKYSWEGGKNYTTDKKKMSKWIVYTNPKNSEAGKVGMVYKNALTYYSNTKKKKGSKTGKKIKLDAVLIWNGSWRPGNLGRNNNLQFATDGIGIKEPYQGAANFTLKLYKAGSNTPFSTRTQIMQTDIDANQGLIFDTPSYLIYDKSTHLNAGYRSGVDNITWNTNVPGKVTIFGDKGKSLGNNQGTVYGFQKKGQLSYIPKKKTSGYNITFVHGYSTVPFGYQSGAKFAKPISSKPTKTYGTGDLKRLADHFDKAEDKKGNVRYTSGGATDYFAYEFDKGSVIPYKINADKLVSTKKNNFKKTTEKKPLTVKDNQTIYFDIHTQLREPSSAVTPVNNKDSDYNALPIKAALKDKNDPNIGKIKDATKNQQRLVLKDYLNSNFELAGDPKIYYAKTWGDSTLKHEKANASKYFDVYTAKATKGKHKGQIVVDAVMKKDAMKLSSDAWMKDYHLIIPVKLKKDASPTKGTKANGWLLLDNKAIVNDEPDGNGDSWVKFKFTHETVKADGKPGVDSKKEVYDANLADPDKLGKKLSWGTNDSNAKLNGDIVNPDQYLYYRLRFTIRPMKAHQKKVTNGKPEVTETLKGGDSTYSASAGDKLIEDKFKNLEITDDLSDRFRNKSAGQAIRDVDKVQVVMDDESKLKNPEKNHDFKLVNGTKLKVNLTKNSDSNILDELSKSDKTHYIYVQYRVRIRPNQVPDHKAKQDLKLDPTDDQYSNSHKVQNQAQIEGTFEERRRYVKNDTKTIEESYTDSNGTYHPGKSESVQGVTKWDQFETKKLSSEKDLSNKTKTNKTINWIHVDSESVDKVPISWSNTNDVINDDDMVWKVQANLASIRSNGGKPKMITLKDTFKSNEKLDASQTWSADNNDDEDLATGTYTGPQVFRNGENVTSKFSISSSGKTVIAKANDSYLEELAKNDPDTPNHFTLAVPGKIVEKKKLTSSGTFNALTVAADKSVVEIEKQNDKEGNKGVYEADWEREPDEDGGNDIETTIHKSVKSIKDLTTGQTVNGTGDGKFLNPKHTFEVTYQVDAQLGTDRDNRNLKISDPLPENTTLVKGSLSVPSNFNTDGTTSTDVHVGYDGNPNVLAAKGTMDNPTVETITYKVKVNPNSDWSNYYNSDTRSGRGTMVIGYIYMM